MGPRKRVKPNPKADTVHSEELPETAAEVPLPHECEGSKELEPPVASLEKPVNAAEAQVSNGAFSTVRPLPHKNRSANVLTLYSHDPRAAGMAVHGHDYPRRLP